jgi:hypothetical protein
MLTDTCRQLSAHTLAFFLTLILLSFLVLYFEAHYDDSVGLRCARTNPAHSVQWPSRRYLVRLRCRSFLSVAHIHPQLTLVERVDSLFN